MGQQQLSDDASSPDPAFGDDVPLRLDLSGKRKELFSNRINDDVLDTLCLACVEVSPKFSVLDLSCNELTDANTIPELLGAASVEHLNLRSNQITAEGQSTQSIWPVS